jgi:hypothetical protein
VTDPEEITDGKGQAGAWLAMRDRNSPLRENAYLEWWSIGLNGTRFQSTAVIAGTRGSRTKISAELLKPWFDWRIEWLDPAPERNEPVRKLQVGPASVLKTEGSEPLLNQSASFL